MAQLLEWQLPTLLTSGCQTCYIPTAEVHLCWDAVQLNRHDLLMLAAFACPVSSMQPTGVQHCFV